MIIIMIEGLVDLTQLVDEFSLGLQPDPGFTVQNCAIELFYFCSSLVRLAAFCTVWDALQEYLFRKHCLTYLI